MIGALPDRVLSSLHRAFRFVLPVAALCLLAVTVSLHAQSKSSSQSGLSQVQPFVDQYCAGCHNADKKRGDLDLEALSGEDLLRHPDAWEKVVRRMRARQMPPAEKKRPDERTYKSVLTRLESTLDSGYFKHPNPGRTETFRRLNRTEYGNAIRDLLAVEIDPAALLPK